MCAKSYEKNVRGVLLKRAERNTFRARAAAHAVKAFEDIKDDRDAKLDTSVLAYPRDVVEEILIDLLADLRHLAFHLRIPYEELDAVALDHATEEMIEAEFK